MTDAIDCVVVGFYEIPVGGLIAASKKTHKFNGTYRHYLANTLDIRGERITYPEFLNHVVTSATGESRGLHVSRMPNLGACYLTSYLRKRSFHAEQVNFFNQDSERLKQLLAQNPRSVAITTTFYIDHQPIRAIVDFIRQYNQDAKIIVGGPHVFNVVNDYDVTAQDMLLSLMGADIFIFSSEGELALSRVCTALQEPNPDFSSIPNLIISDEDGKLSHTKIETENNNLDENVIDWRGFNKELLVPTVQTRTARSCAFQCSFCRYPYNTGELVHIDLSFVEKECDYLHSIGVRQLLFIDDTFNIPLDRFKDLCRMLIKNKYNFNWFSYFRCANADEEAYDLAAEAGCTGVFLGIESGSHPVLKAMNKGADPEKYRHGIKSLNDRGIITFCSLVVGFPGETEETVRETFDFVRETKPSYYCLELFFCDLKAPIGEKSAEYGLKGAAYNWRHNTMDWKRATELVEEGYRTIKESVILPLYSFDLWSVAYLMGKGMEKEKIREFLKISSEILVRGFTESSFDTTDQEQRAVSIFKK